MLRLMDKQQEYVLRTVEERDIRFVRLWFTDVLGMLKSRSRSRRPSSRARSRRASGSTGRRSTGSRGCRSPTCSRVPDASTFQVLPWRDESGLVGRMFCDIRTPQGEPFAADPRQVLRRNLTRGR